MSKYQIIAPALSSMPWQERPDEPSNSPLWRWNENPIIGRNPIKGVARIFNSAVMPYEGKYIGVFRGEQCDGVSFIYLGHSDDGIHWTFEPDKLQFVDEKGEPFQPIYAYDPRLVKVEDTYYIIWCQDFWGAAIGMAIMSCSPVHPILGILLSAISSSLRALTCISGAITAM